MGGMCVFLFDIKVSLSSIEVVGCPEYYKWYQELGLKVFDTKFEVVKALEVLPTDMEAQAKAELNKKAHSTMILCLGNKVLREVTRETTTAENTLAEYMILSSADNRPPMSDKDLLHTSNYDQLHVYLEQHELHVNEFNHSSIPPSHSFQSHMNHQTSTVLQVAYQSPQAPTQLMTESPFVDSGFAVLVFSPVDDLIACFNKAMTFLTAIASLRFSSTKNQLRTSFNTRNQATIQDGRVIVQQVQGRQGKNYSGTTYKGNATSSRGNTTSGQARIVKCYNCQGEGHMARQCTQPKRQRNAAWYKEKAMLAEAQEVRKYWMRSNSHFLQIQEFQQVKFKQSFLIMLFSRLRISILMILTVMISRINKRFLWPTFPTMVLTLSQSREKMIDSQMDDMIKEKLALKEKVDSLEQKLSKQITEKECLLETFNVFKNKSKSKENKYMETKIDLEEKIKELNNIVFKVGQSAQTVHMLTKPQLFYDNVHKQALEYFKKNDLKALLKDKDTTICKLKDTIKSLRKNDKEEIVDHDRCDLATGNGDPPVPDLRTMEELCQPSLNGRGGTFMKRRPEECYDLIENMTAHQNDWHTSAQQSESSSSITSSFDQEIVALKAKMAEINKNLMRVLQVNQQVKAVTPNCETCGCPHSYNDCPTTIGQTQNVYATGAYQDAYQAPAYQALGYQALVHQPSIPQPQAVTTAEFTNYMKANDAILKNMQTNMTSLTNSNLELKNMFGQFMKMNTASSLGLGTLPSNTITNPKENLKVERETEVTKDMVPPTNNESTKDVQHAVVQVENLIPNSEPVVAPIIEPVVAPVSALKLNQKLSIPYPSRLHDQNLYDKTNNQKEKFFQIFQDLNFNISFADALILMPKFGPTIKTLLTNKDKLSELARTLLNEHCLAVLLKKLPEKLRDPDKFLIPCDFLRMDECLALVDLSASINLMPLSVWNKLSLSQLTPTLMTLELADRSISRPIGVAEDVFVKVGKFHFLTDIVVVDFEGPLLPSPQKLYAKRTVGVITI
nr:reverse transcriptase domain-containing protein [Tanacetum cinerariifolium]